jgi:hypothetical protein
MAIAHKILIAARHLVRRLEKHGHEVNIEAKLA